MCLTILVAAAILRGQVPTGDARLDRIVRWRAEFDKQALKLDRGGDVGYPELDSETLGGAHSNVYFPVGSAFERFVIYYPEVNGPPAGILMYEKRTRKGVKVIWRVPLVPLKEGQKVVGAIPKALVTDDLCVSSKAHLTKAMRNQIQHKGYYAAYFFHPMQGGLAWVVNPDGSSTTPHKGPRYWITPEEKQLIAPAKALELKRE